MAKTFKIQPHQHEQLQAFSVDEKKPGNDGIGIAFLNILLSKLSKKKKRKFKIIF